MLSADRVDDNFQQFRNDLCRRHFAVSQIPLEAHQIAFGPDITYPGFCIPRLAHIHTRRSERDLISEIAVWNARRFCDPSETGAGIQFHECKFVRNRVDDELRAAGRREVEMRHERLCRLLNGWRWFNRDAKGRIARAIRLMRALSNNFHGLEKPTLLGAKHHAVTRSADIALNDQFRVGLGPFGDAYM